MQRPALTTLPRLNRRAVGLGAYRVNSGGLVDVLQLTRERSKNPGAQTADLALTYDANGRAALRALEAEILLALSFVNVGARISQVEETDRGGCDVYDCNGVRLFTVYRATPLAAGPFPGRW